MKSTLRLPKEQVAALRPGDVQLYLTGRGWRAEAHGTSPKAIVFRSQSYPQAELLLPANREVRDFVLRMADVVVGLAAIEGRSAWAILNDLSGPPGDVMRLRVLAPDSTLGNLPLDRGIQLLRAGRDLLLAAACSAIHPHTFHSQKVRREQKEVDEFLKSCRLGQTERGSFIATIITPVPPEFQDPANASDDGDKAAVQPYPRRVMIRLMSALGFVSEAIETGKPGKILAGVEHGISANLCEALKAMKPTGDQSRLDISVSWAPIRGSVPDTVPGSVSFPQDSFSFIEEAGRQLRVRALARPARYEGSLVTTEWVHRPFTRGRVGRIVMATQVAGEAAKVKVDLDPKDFRRACSALPSGKRVAVTGVIRTEVKSRVYELSQPQNFEVIEKS